MTPSRIAENFDILGFGLSEDEMTRIATLDRGERIGPDPDVFAVTRPPQVSGASGV